MPLYVDSIPSTLTKGAILRWVLDTDEVKKPQVGSIEIRGRQAIIEVPESAGPRLAKRLDGTSLMGRAVQVWFAAEHSNADTTGHFQKLGRWLDMEERAESERAAQWQTAGDQETSTGWRSLVLRNEEIGLGGYPLLTLGRRDPRQALPATQLSVGSPVRLTEQGPQAGQAQRGVITRIEKHEIEVALNKPLSSENDNPLLRLDAAADEIAAQRSRSALAKACHARGDRLSELRDVCLGLQEPQFDEPAQLQFIDPNLNDSQRLAIVFALAARDVAVIHGPPGSGKTTTLVELIRQAVRKGRKVLACAPSNLGVDNLFERLLERGENTVRLGHPARVRPHLRDRTLKALVIEHPEIRRVKQLRMEAAQLFRKVDRPAPGRVDRHALRAEAQSILADARATEAAVVQEIIEQADIVCATNTGVDSDLLGARRFDLVVIDEACQCTEPSCWIPLGRAERVVLAGDHCQLPPTILSVAAAREGFNVSLQERLVGLYRDRVSRLLLVQYRMHEEIMHHSSAVFYEGRLQAHPSVASHRLSDLPGVKEEELTTTAVRFIDTSGAGYDEEQEAAGSSLCNRGEAVLALKKVQELMDRGVPPSGIAIITPYTAQVRLLRELLKTDAVEVGSIDGFQGREKEAVVISLVRSNQDKEIGFLSDIRRMNVALTRARRKLIVIGDSATINAHPFYVGLLEHFDRIGAYHGVWDED